MIFFKIKYRLFIALVLFAFMAALPNKPRALELGLTPSHVYGIWVDLPQKLPQTPA